MGAYACICFVEVTKCRVLGSRCESCDECRSTGYEFFTRYRRLCKSIGVPAFAYIYSHRSSPPLTHTDPYLSTSNAPPLYHSADTLGFHNRRAVRTRRTVPGATATFKTCLCNRAAWGYRFAGYDWGHAVNSGTIRWVRMVYRAIAINHRATYEIKAIV